MSTESTPPTVSAAPVNDPIPFDHTPIRITSQPPSRVFSGEASEYDIWHRDMVNKAALNGVHSVIKGERPTNWSNLK